MNFFFAVILLVCGVWLMTAAMKIHLDDVEAAHTQSKADYKSQFAITAILATIASIFLCAAIILSVQIGVNL